MAGSTYLCLLQKIGDFCQIKFNVSQACDILMKFPHNCIQGVYEISP